MKKTIFIILAVLLAFAFCACNSKMDDNNKKSEESTVSATAGEESTTAMQNTKLKIGVIGSGDGYYSTFSSAQLSGINDAHSKKSSLKINEKTYDIELINGDPVTSTSTAKSTANSLLSKGVSAVICSLPGEYSTAVASVLEEKGIPFIDVFSSPSKLTEDYECAFSLTSSDYAIGEKVAAYCAVKLKADKVGILCALGDESAESMAYFCSQKLKAYGINSVIKTFDKSETSLSEYVAQLKEEGCTCLFAPVPAAFAEDIIKSAEENGITELVTTSAWKTVDVSTIVNSHSVHVYSCMNFSGDDAACSSFPYSTGYDAYMLVRTALKKSVVKNISVLSALSGIEYKGETVTISFDSIGVLKTSPKVYKLFTF